MRKASELYELNNREIILLELFNRMDDKMQIEKLSLLSGYLFGAGFISETESFEYIRRIKKD